MGETTKFCRVAVSDLIPYINNAKIHTEDQITRIASSIREFGFLNPVLIDAQKNVIAGHGRIMAAKKLGMTEVPCVYVEGLTDAQRKAYILADNRLAEMADWDMDLVRGELEELQELGFDIELTGFELDIEEDPDVVEDEMPEDVESRAKEGDIWQLGEHRVICGDSTDVTVLDKLMDGAKADLLLTDPPYNIALGMHPLRPSEAKRLHRRTDGLVIKNDSWETDDEFIDFLVSAYNSALTVMKSGAVFYIWYASTQALNFLIACEKAGMQVRQTLVWNKSVFAFGRQDYQWKHEPCLYGWKEGAAHYFVDDRTQSTVVEDAQEINPDKMKKPELVALVKELLAPKTSTTVIYEDKPARSEQHPTMKPIKLFARLIKNSTKTGENVLDCFGGSGTALIACEQLKRTAYLCELDPHYCDVIIQRWENFTGRKAVLLNG